MSEKMVNAFILTVSGAFLLFGGIMPRRVALWVGILLVVVGAVVMSAISLSENRKDSEKGENQ